MKHIGKISLAVAFAATLSHILAGDWWRLVVVAVLIAAASWFWNRFLWNIDPQ
jgi:hypothetical protein